MSNKFSTNKVAIAILTLPAIVLFSVVVIYPAMQSLFKSFYEWDGINTAVFVGFDNYTRLLDDGIFHTSIKNGLIFTFIITVCQIFVATVLALFIHNDKLPGRKFFRSVFFIPVVLSTTITSQLWVSMLDPRQGLLNKVFEMAGLSYQQDWLGSTDAGIYVMAFMNSWQYLGYDMIIIYAALKSLPSQFSEAARIDGASKIREFFSITLPLLSEAYKMCLILVIPGGLKAFEQMLIMTAGGPGTSTYTLSLMIYRSFTMGQLGYGSAVSVILVLQCILALIFIEKFVARERITY